MKIEKGKLLNVLERVKPGIASKEIVESMTYFFFTGKEIVTYNDKISIQHPFETEFSLFVKADKLFKIIQKIKTKTLELSKKGDKLHIKANTVKAELPIIEEDQEIISRIGSVRNSLSKVKWENLPENFLECISLCSFCSSSIESEQLLTCVYVDGKDCVASDNSRISHAILKDTISPMFIKSSEIKNITSIDPKRYYISKSWLHFQNEDGCIFSMRTMVGEFPDFLSFFDFDGKSVDLPAKIIDGMDLAEVFVDEIDPSVKIEIENNVCKVSTHSDSGNIIHRSKVNYKGDRINFIINPLFLKQMMRHSSSIIVSDNKVRLETNDKGFSIVTALLK